MNKTRLQQVSGQELVVHQPRLDVIQVPPKGALPVLHPQPVHGGDHLGGVCVCFVLFKFGVCESSVLCFNFLIFGGGPPARVCVNVPTRTHQ